MILIERIIDRTKPLSQKDRDFVAETMSLLVQWAKGRGSVGIVQQKLIKAAKKLESDTKP